MEEESYPMRPVFIPAAPDKSDLYKQPSSGEYTWRPVYRADGGSRFITIADEMIKWEGNRSTLPDSEE